MVALAALDFVGAVCAKVFADRHRVLPLAAGACVFVVLFVVYVAALRFAELSIVTMGWVVLLQVGVLALDTRRYGLQLDGWQWSAVVVMIALQLYLIVTTSTAAAATSVGDKTTRALPTPSLVVDLEVVAQRYAELAAALPGVAIHYAVKANPAPEVLRQLVRSGSSFDVASPAEISACLSAGAPPDQLSYGNTAKKERDIGGAYDLGVRVFTFDDATELDKLSRAAPGATLLCRIATTGDGADWALSNKFGCAPDRALELLTAAAADGHPVGVAFHVGSQQRDPSQWDAPIRVAATLQAQLADRGIALSLLDIGGGFPAWYRTSGPPIGDYGRSISASLNRHLRVPLPRVIAEPGRFLVADAGVIETEVVLVADRGGERWVHLDIGLFGGLAEALDEAIEYRIQTDLDGEPTGPVVLAGPTCDSVDVLYRVADYRLPLGLKAGDHIRLLSTGAYTASYSSVGFNGLPPLECVCVSGTARPPAAVGVPDLVPAGPPLSAA